MEFLPAIFSFLLSLITIPLVRTLAARYGYVKKPRHDRWHRLPVPTLGGAGVFMAFSLAMILWVFLAKGEAFSLISLWISIGLAFTIGFVDDLHPLSPTVKLAGQFLAATIFIFFGNQTIDFFPWPIANILLTMLWLVGITNSINLLDNIDGLASGVSLIAAGMLCIVLWEGSYGWLLSMALALSGALAGFLIFNFPPAKIFMGDSGSLFIGFLLAALAVLRKSQASNVFAVLGVPILLFLLPILDTTLVTITRLLRGQSPAQGGTDHTSHRLVTFGLTERQAVFVLYGVALVGGLSAIALEALDYETSLVLIPLVLIALSLVAAYLGRLKVVTVATTVKNGFSHWMADLAYRRRLFELLLDLALVGFSYYLAYWMRYGLDMTPASMSLFLRSWPVAMLAAFLVFFVLGVYKGVWGYISIDNFLRFAGAGFFAALITWTLTLALYPGQGYPLGAFVYFAFFLFLALAGSRSSFVILDRFSDRQRVNPQAARVILAGAGDEGEFALRWIQRNPHLGYLPVGFVDDDQSLWGRQIFGVEIIGKLAGLESLLENKHIDGVILTDPGLLKHVEVQKIVACCQERGIWVRVLRLEFEPVQAGEA